MPTALREACSANRDQGTGDGLVRDKGWVWVHAVSVGEVIAASGVVAGLREAGFRVAISTTTEAGQELAKRRFGECPVFYMPLDFGLLVGAVFSGNSSTVDGDDGE